MSNQKCLLIPVYGPRKQFIICLMERHGGADTLRAGRPGVFNCIPKSERGRGLKYGKSVTGDVRSYTSSRNFQDLRGVSIIAGR